MSEPALEICFDAKNVLIERSVQESPSSQDKDAKPLKRRAPKSPPKTRPRGESTHD